jgi:cyanuric acid amidohydrolase
MAIVVAKVELKSVMDASGIAACIEAGAFGADEVVAVIGKTEGNGGVNDFTRILADQAFRGVLRKLGNCGEAAIARVPMVWSGGCDGVITPHATVFARNPRTGEASASRIAIAVGGVAAAAIGDPAVFVSVDAMHQGPEGGGPVIAIVDVGE